jgi:cell division protein ZipA
MDPTQLRILLLILGAFFIAGVYWFGRPRKPGQGRRLGERGTASAAAAAAAEPRGEPAFAGDAHESLDKVIQAELARLERTLAADTPGTTGSRSVGGIEFEPDLDARLDARLETPPERAAPRSEAGQASPGSSLGARPNPEFDKVVSLIVAARAGTLLHGSDILVAAEKVGLVFGDMQIFHRLPENRPEAGPIFSVANVVKPGNFDLRHPDQTQTPGVTFFMTLPGPQPALDAWEAMLPAAQRFAELLDAVVLDDERNALGRQRIQFLRDEMRAYDRERERQSKRPW